MHDDFYSKKARKVVARLHAIGARVVVVQTTSTVEVTRKGLAGLGHRVSGGNDVPAAVTA